jgi:hypothetical protein
MTPNDPHVKFHYCTAEHFHAVFVNYAVQLHTIRFDTEALHSQIILMECLVTMLLDIFIVYYRFTP